MLTDGEMKMKEEENDCVPLAALQVKSSQTTLRRAPQIVLYLITDPSLISLCPYLTSIMSATWLMGYSFLTRWSWYERLWWASTVQWVLVKCHNVVWIRTMGNINCITQTGRTIISKIKWQKQQSVEIWLAEAQRLQNFSLLTSLLTSWPCTLQSLSSTGN